MTDHHLARLADAAAERFDDRDALWFEGRWWRTRELQALTHRVAGGLVTELGVRPGDRVVLFLPNLPEVGALFPAVWRAGAVVTPVIFLLPAPQLRQVLEDAEPSVVVTSPEFLDTVRTATDGLDLRVVLLGAEAPDVVAFDALAAADPRPVVDRDDGDLAALLFTGGTTGRSKGVALSHENLWRCARSTHERADVPGVNRTATALPMAHAFGMIVTVAGMHATQPGANALLRWFEPAAFLDAIEDHRMQRATLVPSMLRMLLAEDLESRDLSSWQHASCGSAPLPVEWVHELERRVPTVTVLEGYGCTESSAVLTSNPPEARRLGSVGTVLPDHELRVVDDDGAPVPPGEPGEVVARGPGIMQGYWRDPEATAATIVDGWLHTGDVGELDADGYLTILDRKKDLVIRGGFNVYPSDVEEALTGHPDVAVAAVVGRPHDRLGEEVVAVVQRTPGSELAADDLVAWSREHIGGYRYPREVHLVDAVPLTPVMKIDRRAARAMVVEP